MKKPRTTWTVKVINVNHQSAKEYAASSSRWANGWGGGNHGWEQHYPFAVVVDRTSPKGKKSKALKTICRNQTDALRGAQQMIDKESERFEVEFEDGKAPAQGVALIHPTFRNTFGELLTRTEEATQGTIQDVEDMLLEIDEVLGLVPVLQARRDEIAAVYDKRTVGLIEQ